MGSNPIPSVFECYKALYEKLKKINFFDYKRKKIVKIYLSIPVGIGKSAIQPLWLALRVGIYTIYLLYGIYIHI